MNALALIIGNAAYEKDRLINAVNDAEDLGKKLLRLGFTVNVVTDITIESFDNVVEKFGEDLKSYDAGLFYFSGHGLQIDGVNYLTAIDNPFTNESAAKRYSYTLDDVIKCMETAGPKTKILILDACRDNPLKGYRGASLKGLAPVYAPKGTLIAFSTSPGEKAMDYGSGRNSIYTGSLLNHIDDPFIPIEDFFKRVRTSVHTMTDGKQTSWEHTSLIGDFYFNSGALFHSVEIPYKEDYVADENFVSSGSEIHEVIMGLKSHNFYKQKAAMYKFYHMDAKAIDQDSLFLVGRNILQAAVGDEGESKSIFAKLDKWLEKYTIDGQNHLLNGILFEMYFNSKGKFRMDDFKSDFVNEIFKLQTNGKYISSFDFITKALEPFRKVMFYFPTNPPIALPIELEFKVIEEDALTPYKRHRLLSVKHAGIELIKDDYMRRAYAGFDSYDEFVESLCRKMCVPKNQLRLTLNVDPNEIVEISTPMHFKLSKVNTTKTADTPFSF